MLLPDPKTLLPEIVKRLVATANPLKIILFGSLARETSTIYSDVDLMVIEKKVDSKYREAVRLRRALIGILAPIDLIVISEEEFDIRSMTPSTVYYWAKIAGKILYEAA